MRGTCQAGYSIMTVVALFAGCLLTASVLGKPAVSRRPSKAARLAALAGTGVVYAVYGWALQSQASVLEVPWYNVAGHPWDGSVAAAPETAGPIMWILAAIGLGTCAVMVIAEKATASLPAAADKAGETAAEVSSTAG